MVTRNPFNSGLRIMFLTVIAPLMFVLTIWAMTSYTYAGSVDMTPSGVWAVTVR